MRNRMYGGVRGRKTKVGGKLLRFPPTRFESEFKNIFFLCATAGNSERSSDGCKEGDCNLQNCFPSIYFHHL